MEGPQLLRAGVGAGCLTCWGHVCGAWAGGAQPCLPKAQMLLTRVPYVCMCVCLDGRGLGLEAL